VSQPFLRSALVALCGCLAAAILVLPPSALAGSGGGISASGTDTSGTDTSGTDTSGTDTSGTDPAETTPPPPVAGEKAKLRRSGLAVAPASAPPEVQAAIEAANRIDDASYCTGGGHGKWNSDCYDCSGAVSYVLGPKGAGILDSPLPSGDFRRWGERKRGSWITVYYNAGHAFVTIAGLRFDTSILDDGQEGPGWSKDVRAGLVNGPFKKRHFAGL
jgi:hypothetical protein